MEINERETQGSVRSRMRNPDNRGKNQIDKNPKTNSDENNDVNNDENDKRNHAQVAKFSVADFINNPNNKTVLKSFVLWSILICFLPIVVLFSSMKLIRNTYDDSHVNISFISGGLSVLTITVIMGLYALKAYREEVRDHRELDDRRVLDDDNYPESKKKTSTNISKNDEKDGEYRRDVNKIENEQTNNKESIDLYKKNTKNCIREYYDQEESCGEYYDSCPLPPQSEFQYADPAHLTVSLISLILKNMFSKQNTIQDIIKEKNSTDNRINDNINNNINNNSNNHNDERSYEKNEKNEKNDYYSFETNNPIKTDLEDVDRDVRRRQNKNRQNIPYTEMIVETNEGILDFFLNMLSTIMTTSQNIFFQYSHKCYNIDDNMEGIAKSNNKTSIKRNEIDSYEKQYIRRDQYTNNMIRSSHLLSFISSYQSKPIQSNNEAYSITKQVHDFAKNAMKHCLSSIMHVQILSDMLQKAQKTDNSVLKYIMIQAGNFNELNINVRTHDSSDEKGVHQNNHIKSKYRSKCIKVYQSSDRNDIITNSSYIEKDSNTSHQWKNLLDLSKVPILQNNGINNEMNEDNINRDITEGIKQNIKKDKKKNQDIYENIEKKSIKEYIKKVFFCFVYTVSKLPLLYEYIRRGIIKIFFKIIHGYNEIFENNALINRLIHIKDKFEKSYCLYTFKHIINVIYTVLKFIYLSIYISIKRSINIITPFYIMLSKHFGLRSENKYSDNKQDTDDKNEKIMYTDEKTKNIIHDSTNNLNRENHCDCIDMYFDDTDFFNNTLFNHIDNCFKFYKNKFYINKTTFDTNKNDFMTRNYSMITTNDSQSVSRSIGTNSDTTLIKQNNTVSHSDSLYDNFVQLSNNTRNNKYYTQKNENNGPNRSHNPFFKTDHYTSRNTSQDISQKKPYNNNIIKNSNNRNNNDNKNNNNDNKNNNNDRNNSNNSSPIITSNVVTPSLDDWVLIN